MDQERLVDPFSNDDQMEFQNFMLSSAEEELITGKLNPELPLPVTQSQPQQSQAFWTLAYWQQYFNINTTDLTDRMLGTVSTKSFSTILNSNPDLYGPFWIPTTVIFLLFASSTVATSISSNRIDISILTFAAIIVYSYLAIMSGLIYAIARYHKLTLQLFTVLNVFGYGMAIWMPVSLLCIIPVDIIRWLVVSAAFASSSIIYLIVAFFLVRTLKPLLDEMKACNVVLALVILAQAALSLVFKIGFYFFPIVVAK